MLNISIFLKVDSAMMVKGGDSVDIGCGDAFGGGEEVDNSVEKVQLYTLFCYFIELTVVGSPGCPTFSDLPSRISVSRWKHASICIESQ